MSAIPRTTNFVVAAAVLALTACGGEEAAAPAAGNGGASGEVEAGDMYFDPEQLEAPAGEVEITLVNVGQVEHDFVIEEAGDAEVVHTDPGETGTGTIELESGTYTFYCSIPGHRSSMEGILEVG